MAVTWRPPAHRSGGRDDVIWRSLGGSFCWLEGLASVLIGLGC
jgi:hypothetical protein